MDMYGIPELVSSRPLPGLFAAMRRTSTAAAAWMSGNWSSCSSITRWGMKSLETMAERQASSWASSASCQRSYALAERNASIFMPGEVSSSSLDCTCTVNRVEPAGQGFCKFRSCLHSPSPVRRRQASAQSMCRCCHISKATLVCYRGEADLTKLVLCLLRNPWIHWL